MKGHYPLNAIDNINDSSIDSNSSNCEKQKTSAKKTKRRKMKEPSVSQNLVVETSNLHDLLENPQERSRKNTRKPLKTYKNINKSVVICEEIPPDETVTIELNEGNVTIIPVKEVFNADEIMTVVHQEYAQ